MSTPLTSTSDQPESQLVNIFDIDVNMDPNINIHTIGAMIDAASVSSTDRQKLLALFQSKQTAESDMSLA
eukprot:6236446-Amphidinium_carterae.2